jgi:hypothetical protein
LVGWLVVGMFGVNVGSSKLAVLGVDKISLSLLSMISLRAANFPVNAEFFSSGTLHFLL